MTAADMVQASAGGLGWGVDGWAGGWLAVGATRVWKALACLEDVHLQTPRRCYDAACHPPFPPLTNTTDALNRRASKRTHRLSFPPSVYVSAVLVPEGSPIAVDRAALERLGVRHILEVPSVPAPDGRGVHYEPDGLVAAVAAVLAAHRTQQQRQAAQPWRPGWAPAQQQLTRRSSI